LSQVVMAVGNAYPEAPAHSDPTDVPGSHFLNSKIISQVNQKELEKQYLFVSDYEVVLPNPDAVMKAPPSDCIAVYRATFNHGM